MAESQRHGFIVENAVAKSGMYPGAPEKRGYTGEWDIGPEHSPSGLPVSVKTLPEGSRSVGMGDALRHALREDACELVVAFYEQKGDKKSVCRLSRLRFGQGAWAGLAGGLTREDIEKLDALVKSIPPGDGQAAQAGRKAAHALKRELNAKPGHLKLHPKIDSKTQRRLQVSADLEAMRAAAHSAEDFGAGSCAAAFGNMVLPWEFDSPRRARKGKAQKAQEAQAREEVRERDGGA